MRAKIHHISAILFFVFFSLVSGLVPPAFCSTTYTTNFSLTENPISESGKWINGKTVGLDWADIRTSPAFAYGTQTDTLQYDDSTAVLSGTWGPNQSAWATVRTVNQTSGVVEDVEIRLRTTISAHSITGYEIKFRCTADGSQYVQIVRWNGALGNLTLIDSRPGPGLHNGDEVKAAISGSTITAYVNGTAIFSATDSTFTTGSPGMGFYIQNGSASQEGDYGFTSFTANDGSPTQLFSSTGPGQTYSTNFPLTENPISEGGMWTNGTLGGFGIVETSGGFAYGASQVGAYGDAVAVLNGSWSPTQAAQVTVKITGSVSSDFNEVEIELHKTITSGSITGYEINCSVNPNHQYIQIVAWDGPAGTYHYVDNKSDNADYCKNGDTLRAEATVSGSTTTIKVYYNGTLKITASDTHYPSGAPGIGFYTSNGTPSSVFPHFGFSSFTATDSPPTSGPAPPTNLTIVVN